jgi:xylan 1,4-beta-xylosidase
LNGVGFDPSLFHDEDGRRWLVQVQWDFRPDRSSFAGIVLREYDHPRRSLVGPQHTLLYTDDLIEGPNLYRRGGWYHLMLAEGGTGWHHGIGTARARHITGPYQRDPAGPVLTARGDESLPLQKAGHGELVCTPGGEWYLAYLASRPVHTAAGRFCVLGRETCLQRVDFPMDGWLRLADGGTAPAVSTPAPADVPAGSTAPRPDGMTVHMRESTDHFDVAELDPSWSSLRVPVEESWCSLRERPGWLRLRGRDSVHSLFTQSLLAKPLPSVHCVVTTRLDFRPTRFTQCAGLICWYDTTTHYYLRVTRHESSGRVLGLVYSDLGGYVEPSAWQVPLPDDGDIWLRASFGGAELTFAYALDGRQWQPVGSTVDATRLSDDYGDVLRFTGAMVGLCAQDLAGSATPADFSYFTLAADPCSPVPSDPPDAAPPAHPTPR